MRRLLLCFLYALFAAQAAEAIDINGYLKKAALENQSTDPTTTLTGRVYWNTTVQSPKVYNGTSWVTLGSGAAVSPTAYSVSPSAVTSVGTAGFPQLGHVLTTADFTAPSSTQYTFWNLSANANDGGPLGKNLTLGTAPTYGATGILGGSTAATFNGSTQYVGSSDAFLNPGNANFGAGGWFKANGTWNPGSTYELIAQSTSGTDVSFRLRIPGSTNTIEIDTANTLDATSFAGIQLSASVAGWASSSWHHVAFTHDTSQNVLLYLDGKLAASGVAAGTMRASGGTAAFNVGAITLGSVSQFFNGSAEDVFMINGYLPTADDIRKLAARRFDHNKGIATNSQLWSANWGRSDSNVGVQLDSSWLVSKSTNSLWADFSGVATGAYVDLSLQNTGLVGTQLFPNSTYDSGVLSTTPATTIAHNLGSRPASIVYEYETSTGHFTPLQGSNFCEADSTNLYCDWTGLSVSASNRLEIIAGGVPLLSAVPLADATTNGIVNSNGAQTIGGAKTFSGRVTSANSKVRAHLGADQTAAASSTTIVGFDTKNGTYDFDTNGELDVTTNKGRFTATSAGYYAVTCSATVLSATQADGDSVNVYKNGTARLGGGLSQGTTNPRYTAVDIVFLNGTTDYVDCRLFNGNAASRSISSNSNDPGATVMTVAQLP